MSVDRIVPSDIPVPVADGARVPRGRLVDASAWSTFVVVAAIFALFQVMSLFAPAYIMPSPRQMIISTYQIVVEDWRDLGITVARLMAALIAAMVVGSLLGGMMGLLRRFAPYARSFLFILSGVPSLSWILLAVLWFPQPEARIFFILVVVTLPFYALNVYDAIRALPTEWVEMLNVFRPSRGQAFRMLVIPHVLPTIVMTSKSVSGYAIRMVVFAELIGATIGIGAKLAQSQSLFRVDAIFGWTILLIVLNFAIQWLVELIERRLFKWRPAVEFR
jgi:NitT/TauT family transport system permease protein